MNKSIEFRTYEIAKHDPFEQFPNEKFIYAESDSDGMYTLHVRFKNGLGLSSTEKLTFHDAAVIAFAYAEEIGYSEGLVWVDLPEHVLEQPDVLNRTLKKSLQRAGLYWKGKKKGVN
ncbi:MAG: hypothetical protein AAGU16_05610 [Desulfitobacterium hafniense]